MKKYRSLMYLFLIIVTLAWMSPISLAFLNSLKTTAEVTENMWMFPRKLTLSSYSEAWYTAHFNRYFINSVLITSFSVMLLLAVVTPAAYAFSKLKFRGNEFLFTLILFALVMPVQLVLIPLYDFFNQVGLMDTRIGLVILEATYCFAFSTFLLRNFFMGIPRELSDSARIDGCNDWQIFSRVILPVAKPAVATVIIFTTTWIWNEFLFCLIFLHSESKRTLPLGLSFLVGEHVVIWNLLMASALITGLVPLLVFLVFQKYFVSGITSGAVKG